METQKSEPIATVEKTDQNEKKVKMTKVYSCQGVKDKNTVILKYLGKTPKKDYKYESAEPIGQCDSHIKDVKGYLYPLNLRKDDFDGGYLDMLKIYFWRHVQSMTANLLEVTCYFVPDPNQTIKKNKEITGKFKYKVTRLLESGAKSSVDIDGPAVHPGNYEMMTAVPKNEKIKEALETQIKNFLKEIGQDQSAQ